MCGLEDYVQAGEDNPTFWQDSNVWPSSKKAGVLLVDAVQAGVALNIHLCHRKGAKWAYFITLSLSWHISYRSGIESNIRCIYSISTDQ